MGALTHNGEVLQGLPANASQINFDKTGTNLNSTQTENAIKEVNTKANTNADDITQLKSGLTNIKAGVVEVTAEATAYGYTTVSVPYGNTNYSVVLTVGYASNFTEAVLAVNTKTGSDVRIGFFNKSNASLTLPINYVIIPNN